MAKRTMSISIIGCLNNCINAYQEKLRTLRDLLNDSYVRDEIADEIKEYLGDGEEDIDFNTYFNISNALFNCKSSSLSSLFSTI